MYVLSFFENIALLFSGLYIADATVIFFVGDLVFLEIWGVFLISFY